jgi:transcriptional regulator with XRE-family HTH domain
MPFLRHPHNRLRAIIQHIDTFYFQGITKLAHEAGVSHSAISRICSGKSGASYPVVCAIADVLEKHLGKRIDPREIVSFNGTYPTQSVCELCNCKGCLPREAWDEVTDEVKPEYKGIKTGAWSLSVGSGAVTSETQKETT